MVFFILSAASFAVCFVLYGIVGHGVIPMIDERMDVVLGWNWGFIFPLLLNPFAFQLWFLAQLFILCLISPVIYFLVKKLKAASVVAIGALWYLDLSPTIPFNFDAYVFFMLGAYIAVNKIELPGLHRQVENKHLKYIFASAWIALSVVFTIMAATLTQSTYIQTLLSRTIVVLGLISVWLIFDGAGGDTNRFIETLKRNSFSVYLFHEPILHIVFMSVLFYFKSDAVHMALFFLLPSAIIITCAYFGEFLRRKLPRVHKTITGGR